MRKHVIARGVLLLIAMVMMMFSIYHNQIWAAWAWLFLLPYNGYKFGEELRLYRAYRAYLIANAKLASQIYNYEDYEMEPYDAEDA